MEDKTFATPRGVLGKRQRITSSGSTPGGSRKVKNAFKRVNPFERDLIDKLHLPVWSPSILQSIVDTPPQKDWTINQIAMINPQNIEESPSTHQHSESLEPELEDKAQASIQMFFDNFHVPSPAPADPSTKLDKSSNTDLSFPPELPSHVMELLYSHSQGTDTNHSCNPSAPSHHRQPYVPDAEAQNLLNNSSVLRRKLDFSFDLPDDSLLKSSDESDIEERKCHGAFIMSP